MTNAKCQHRRSAHPQMAAVHGLSDLYLSLSIGILRALGVDPTHTQKDFAFKADVPTDYAAADLPRLSRCARNHVTALLQPTDWQMVLLRVHFDTTAQVVFGEGSMRRKPPARRGDDNNATA